MYSIDGDFGRVKHIKFPPDANEKNFDGIPFHYLSGGWHKCNSKYKFIRPQGLDFHILFFSVSSGGEYGIADKSKIPIPASSALFLPANCPHSYYTQPGKIWEFYWINISKEVNLPFADIFKENNIIPISDIHIFTREFENLIQNPPADKIQFAVETSRLLSNLYHSLLAESLKEKSAKKEDSLIRKITDEMKSSCEKNWNLEELSKQYFISVPQLIRRFKASTGMPPHIYLTGIRLETAKMYLKYTSMTVDEISARTGFLCTSNFIRRFKAHYGITPGSYRNQ